MLIPVTACIMTLIGWSSMSYVLEQQEAFDEWWDTHVPATCTHSAVGVQRDEWDCCSKDSQSCEAHQSSCVAEWYECPGRTTCTYADVRSSPSPTCDGNCCSDWQPAMSVWDNDGYYEGEKAGGCKTCCNPNKQYMLNAE